jgi:hypothetical protein
MLRKSFGPRICRLIPAVIAVFSLAAAPARAALDCDQLVAAAQTAVNLRDQGMSLTAVMNDIERSELRKQLDARELNLLQQIVRVSFTSESSVYEIFESCNAGQFGLARSKGKPKP